MFTKKPQFGVVPRACLKSAHSTTSQAEDHPWLRILRPSGPQDRCCFCAALGLEGAVSASQVSFCLVLALRVGQGRELNFWRATVPVWMTGSILSGVPGSQLCAGGGVPVWPVLMTGLACIDDRFGQSLVMMFESNVPGSPLCAGGGTVSNRVAAVRGRRRDRLLFMILRLMMSEGCQREIVG